MKTNIKIITKITAVAVRILGFINNRPKLEILLRFNLLNRLIAMVQSNESLEQAN
jgi:hypothetical protein